MVGSCCCSSVTSFLISFSLTGIFFVERFVHATFSRGSSLATEMLLSLRGRGRTLDVVGSCLRLISLRRSGLLLMKYGCEYVNPYY